MLSAVLGNEIRIWTAEHMFDTYPHWMVASTPDVGHLLGMEQCFPPLMVMVFASVLNRCFVQVFLVVPNVLPVVLQLLQTAGEVVDGGTLR